MSEVLEFNVPVNLANASTVDVTDTDPPAGPFEVEILNQSLSTNEKNQKVSLRYNVVIVEEGPAKGLTTSLFVGTDFSKSFNVGHLMNLLHGLHTADGKFIPPEKVKAIGNITPELTKGKRAYIFVKVPPAGEIDEATGKAARPDKNFIPPANYKAQKSARAGVTVPAAASAPPKAANGTAGAPLGDLFS